MPTYETLPRFLKDFDRLSAEEQQGFLKSVAKLVADLKRGREVRAGLRVKGVRGSPGVYELTWAQDGRATLHFGEPVRAGEAHIVWRRVETHNILDEA